MTAFRPSRHAPHADVGLKVMHGPSKEQCSRYMLSKLMDGHEHSTGSGAPRSGDSSSGGAYREEPHSAPAERLGPAAATGRVVRGGALGSRVRSGTRVVSHDAGTWPAASQLDAADLIEVLTAPDAPLRAVVLEDLRITGFVNLGCAELRAPLIARRCHFDHPVMLSSARGSLISMTSCRIPGLVADGLEVSGDLSLAFSEVTLISLCSGQIGGRLLLQGAVVTSEAWPMELANTALPAPTTGEDAVPKVAVMASGTRIAGEVNLDGATLHGRLGAEELEVAGCVVGRPLAEGRFTASGLIAISGSRIRGHVKLDGAKLAGGLLAEGIVVDGNMFCRANRDPRRPTTPFEADQQVILSYSQIAGQLEFDGAMLVGGLHGERLKVGGYMVCRNGFQAAAEVSLRGAELGSLSFDGASLHHTPYSLFLAHATIRSELHMRFAESPEGIVDLGNTSVGVVRDAEGTWPAILRVNGLTYTALDAVEDDSESPRQHWWDSWLGTPADVQRRLTWLRLDEAGPLPSPRKPSTSISEGTQAGYAPQPYSELFSYYRRQGRDGDARTVGFERERRRRQELGQLGRLWNYFLQWTVGYGYRPLRALAWFSGLVVVGSVAFAHFHATGQLVPIGSDHPQFVATMYAVDRLVPVATFGLRDAFAARGVAEWCAFAYTVCGWALSVAVGAGLAAVVRRG